MLRVGHMDMPALSKLRRRRVSDSVPASTFMRYTRPIAAKEPRMIAIHERVESLCRSAAVGADDTDDTSFVSSVPFEALRIGAAAVYCSDGRYGDQMDEFLHLGLGFPRYDRLAV